MLTRDVRFEGFTAEDWTRLMRLMQPGPQMSSDSPSPKSGGVIAVTSGKKLRKLISTRNRRLDPQVETWPDSLENLAERHGAGWAISIHTGALEEMTDRFGDRLEPGQELLEQAIILAGVLRELEAEGAIQLWPWTPASWPIPSERVASRALDVICPNGKSLALGTFVDGQVHTAVVVRRMGNGFDWIVGPEAFRSEMGLISGDWTRDYRHLVRAMETHVGPLAMGVFAEGGTFERLVSDPAPGAWAAAVAARDVYLAPAGSAVAIPLGLDVGRAAFVAMRGLADRFGVADLLSEDGPIAPAFDRMHQAAWGGRDLESALGFDPFALLRKLVFRPGAEQD